MHRRKAYIYVNFLPNRDSRAVMQNRAHKFTYIHVKLLKFATCNSNFEQDVRTRIFFRARMSSSNIINNISSV